MAFDLDNDMSLQRRAEDEIERLIDGVDGELSAAHEFIQQSGLWVKYISYKEKIMKSKLAILAILLALIPGPAWGLDKVIGATNTFKIGVFDSSTRSNGITGLTFSELAVKVQCQSTAVTINESGDTLVEEGGGFYRVTTDDTLSPNNEDECDVWAEGEGDYSGFIAKAPSRFKAVGTTVGTVTTNNDKTGYSLTQTFPTNFSSLAITGGGAVTAGTVSDKAGYSISGTVTTLDALQANIKGSLGANIDLTRIAQKNTGGAFNADTDSLEAIRDRGDAAWTGGGGGASDWTVEEREQLRYRLGIDGTEATPVTNTPSMDVTLADNAITAAKIAAGAITSSEAPNLDAAVSSRQATGNVTVGAYAAGQGPAEQVLVTPANKLATNASGEVNVAALSTSAVDSILNDTIEGSYTMRQVLCMLTARHIGKATGGATTSIQLRDLGDSRNRITFTVDSNGNRTGVVFDLTGCQ